MVAWLAIAVAAMMQSPMGIFRYLLLSRPACLAIGEVLLSEIIADPKDMASKLHASSLK